ncbi:MAG: cbb3-type cytochrome c oxidase subunit I [Dehalococcoidia bacterium]|nr:cbb3-type cytochrome c oxidase subunit I [Dehalococcoidia bacterium]
MSPTTMRFILSSLVYLLLGVVLGVLFLAFPNTRGLRAVHVHLNLVGFVLFMIMGVAYHILPRFRGRPLISEKLAVVQFWLAEVGLVGLLVFMGIDAYQSQVAISPMAITTGLVVFGTALVVSIVLFVYNLGRTLY